MRSWQLPATTSWATSIDIGRQEAEPARETRFSGAGGRFGMIALQINARKGRRAPLPRPHSAAVGVVATGLLALFANLLDQDRHPDAREGRPTRIAPFGSSLVVCR